MLEAKKGKNRILMFRKLSEMKNESAARLALQTEHEWEYSRDTDLEQTKDGPISTDGGLEVTLSINAIASDDPVNNMLRTAVIEGEKLEVWDIDITKKVGGKYPALYARGNLNSWTIPANVEDYLELETEMIIDGKPQEGEVTLTAEQEKFVQYTFMDITPGA